MKPFDLKAALAGAKVFTRDGREVTQLVKFDLKTKQTLRGVVEGGLFAWSVSGCWLGSEDSELDLFMTSTKKKLWIWVKTDCETDGNHSTSTARPEMSAIPLSVSWQDWQPIEVEIDV